MRFLERNDAAAATIDADTILLRPEYSGRNAVLLHELAHIAQLRSGVTATRDDAEAAARAAGRGVKGSVGGAARPPLFQNENEMVDGGTPEAGAPEAASPIAGTFNAGPEPGAPPSAVSAQERATEALAFNEADAIDELSDDALGAMSVDQRMNAFRILIEDVWTGGKDESTIIKIVSLTPGADAPALLNRITTDMIDQKTYFDKLDDVVDLHNNVELHRALTLLQLTAKGPERMPDVTQLPKLPWHDVMGFFEDDATFSAERRGNKVERKIPRLCFG